MRQLTHWKELTQKIWEEQTGFSALSSPLPRPLAYYDYKCVRIGERVVQGIEGAGH